MAGYTCASLTQLRLSCPFDDRLPGVASWASTRGEGTAGGDALFVHCRRPPRRHSGSCHPGVGRCQPASVLGLRAMSCPCQSRSLCWKKKKISRCAASKRLAWRETRKIHVKPRAALTCAFLSYQWQANAEFKQKVYHYRGFKQQVIRLLEITSVRSRTSVS